MIVRLSDDAERDLLDGIVFYDQHGKEVGDYFFDSMTSDLRSLAVLCGIPGKRFGSIFFMSADGETAIAVDPITASASRANSVHHPRNSSSWEN